MASSSLSSSAIRESKYEVFLSFRGEDTRDNFTSHLHAALRQKEIQTFIDEDGLKRGDDISPTLLKAIEESKISVIIFSKDYASSKWCLNELVKILECKKMNGQIVMPVFYQMAPSDIRKQTGSFKDAFDKHEKDFKKIPEKVQMWRAALTEASNLSGWDSTVIRRESKLVEEIVKEISKKLNDISPSSNCEGLVGMRSCMDDIKSLLNIGASDFRIVGIWGMGGIGKTRIAEVMFSQYSSQFEGCCFISNVREEIDRSGLVHVRNEVLSKILNEDNLAVGTRSLPPYIKKRLQSKKVLIVFDDVNKLGHLEYLAGELQQFGLGSRVIITTRDRQVLHSYGVDQIYEVRRLEDHEALQLFCNYAFKHNPVPKELEMLSRRITNYANGNPLALKVLGSSLHRKSKQEWESMMCKLKKISDPEIHNILIVSYDGLDAEQKKIFLDIACFFRGLNINCVTKILDSCYHSSRFGLSVLIDKSLIFTTKSNDIQMHDLLQEMGWEIVRQESPNIPGKRSRLWNHDDVFHVLKNNTGTDAIEGLVLDMSKVTNLHLSSGAFENMPNLKFLKFYVPDQYFGGNVNINKVHLPHGLKYLPDELRYLHWHGYPSETLPSNFSPKNLIELNLPFSNLDEKLWVATKCGSKQSYLTNLRSLNLSGCKSIRSFPSNIHFRSLITLRLSNCINLTKLPEISGNIEELYLDRTAIDEVPSNIHFRSLITLRLSHCINLKRFPEISGNIEELYLDRTGIDEVPSSIACLTKLKILQLWKCKRMKRISSSICKLTSLQGVDLSCYEIGECQLSSFIACWKDIRCLRLGYCNITEIFEDLFLLSSLQTLDLRGNKFKSLPRSIKQLTQLRRLYLTKCSELESIPELPLALTYLEAGGCSQLQSIAEPPSNPEKLAESQWEIISNCRNMLYIFTNCMKLNQNADNNILKNSHQKIQHMAALLLRLYDVKVFDKILNFGLCLPGTEIPEWFSHQSSGSSITMELPPHWCNGRFMGFALSAVLAFKENFRSHDAISVSCSCHFQDNNSNSAEFQWECRVISHYRSFTSKEVEMLIESNHVALGYSPCHMVVKGDYTTASFEFRLYDHNEGCQAKGVKLKCCGVHLLYAQSNITSIQRFPATSEDLVETTLVDSEDLMELHDANSSRSGNGDGICDEAEMEPGANTTCFLRTCCLLFSLIVLFWLLEPLDGLTLKRGR